MLLVVLYWLNADWARLEASLTPGAPEAVATNNRESLS